MNVQVWSCVLTSPTFCHRSIFELRDSCLWFNGHILTEAPQILIEIFWKQIEQGIHKYIYIPILHKGTDQVTLSNKMLLNVTL